MIHPIQQFQVQLLAENIEAAFISKKANIQYLAGVHALHPTEREAYLIITPHNAILYHSPFISLSPTTKGLVTTIPMSAKEPLGAVIKTFCGTATTLGIEKLDLTVAELERLQFFLPKVTIKPVDDLLSKARKIKKKSEISKIQKACQITTKVMEWVQKFSLTKEAANITEIDLVRALERKGYQLGADGLAFPTIVAFDSHSASPHHTSSHTKLTPHSIVLVDMGFTVEGYMSDMTRTWCLSNSPPLLFQQIQTIVTSAYAAAKKKAQISGSTAADVDKTARDIITQAGYGDTFIHTTGHGLGLETHESPSINSNNQDTLLPGMVITIEPGIYLDGKFGYRHEDTIFIT